MLKKIVIIDYDLGNLFSVKQACEVVGLNSIISSKKEDILNADGLILPGVGAFNEAINNLKNRGLDSVIKLQVKKNIPLFGICLGLQLLFSKTEEFDDGPGLDLISGSVTKIKNNLKKNKLKVPHVGWNKIYSDKFDWDNTPLESLENNNYMYFVHSYYVNPIDKSFILSNTNYESINFCSSVIKNNIFACQFHPEKSGDKGVEIYHKWANQNSLV